MSSGLPEDQGPYGTDSIVRRVAERVQALPEMGRVLIYSGAILLAIAISIVVVVYRAEIWGAFTFLAWATLATVALGGLGYGVVRVVRYNVIYSGTILLGIAISIVVVVYRAEIRHAFTFHAWATLATVVLGGLGYGVVRLVRYNQIKREAAQRSAADARLLWERQRAEMLRAISDGEIQPLSDSGGLFLRNSESLWCRCSAVAVDRKDQSYTGQLYITSLRILFVSADYPIEIPLGSVNAANVAEKCLNLIGKTTGATQTFLIDDPQLVAAHVERTIRAYHRQVDVGFEDGAGRQIAQDVKTAVWQRDCGKCVECGATDYLEFDHIIPYARGGASTVENVQLLCRRCNLKKGCRI